MSDPNHFYEALQIFPNSDGTFTRKQCRFPTTSPSADPNNPTPLLCKDIPINPSTNTWARLFLPRNGPHPTSSHKKLPLILFIHGGGFVLLSAASTINHDFCQNMAVQIPALVVSIEYRLAPEHRLPAAYEDAVEAFLWLKTTDEAWVREHADYDNCFIMGSSAGGNITYQAGLSVAEAAGHDLEPLRIRGLILHHPFFGGAQRTNSELKMKDDPVLPLAVTDLMWEWSLPIGADCDHEYCNPTVGGGSKSLEKMKLMGWRVVVSSWDGDPLIDRQMELVKLLQEKGILVKGHFGEGGYHGLETMDPSALGALLVVIKGFIQSPTVA